MTREEIIKELKELRDEWSGHIYPKGVRKQVSLDIAIKALEQEPISETDIILTREEYGELVSSEYDNGYAKGYREALEQESVIDKIRADLYKLYNDRPSDYNHSQRTELFCEVIKILDKYKAESEDKE